jgi:small subunit ribosomal protein S2
MEANNEEGLKIIENLGDEDDVQTDAAVKREDVEIDDYSNYQPTEQKDEDSKDDDDSADQMVDEDKLYK